MYMKKYPIIKSTEDAIKYIDNLTASEYKIVSGEYNNKGRSIFQFQHSCGNIFPAQFKELRRSFIKSSGGCPECANIKRAKNLSPQIEFDEFSEKFKSYNGSSKYHIVSEHYITNKDKLIFKHLDCGNEFEMRPNDFQQGYRCPVCARKSSIPENELAEFIESIYSGTILRNDRTLINPWELDIYLPDLNIAIEFNGLYWHNEFNKGKTYHKDKLEKCNSKGVRLIQVFEDEWVQKRDIVKSKITNILGLSKLPRVYARKGYIKKISTDEARDFMNKNHIQGYSNSTIKLGFFVNDQLYSVILFNKLRETMNAGNIEKSWDLIRFASDINFIVVGSFSKMLTFFIRKYNPSYIKTLADLRWSDSDNMYDVAGFKEESRVVPRYFYSDGVNREHRFNYRKSAIKTKFPEVYDRDLTEFEMMDKTKLFRIWDAGKITYSLIIKS